MSRLELLETIITNVQFLCGERILSSNAADLQFNAEIMLCSTPEYYSTVLEIFGKLVDEPVEFILEINAEMDEIILIFCLDGYVEFSCFPTLYDFFISNFKYDKLQFSEFERHLRKNDASIVISVGQIEETSVTTFNDDELIFIGAYTIFI